MLVHTYLEMTTKVVISGASQSPKMCKSVGITVNDKVPREMLMARLRWMGVPEEEVRMVEGMYEKITLEWWWKKEHRRSLRSILDSDRAAC